MAINKINVDGFEHELAGSGGGGSDLTCVIDVTEAFFSDPIDYSSLLDVTWFHDNITWDNIHNMRIIFKIENNEYKGYFDMLWDLINSKNEGQINLELKYPNESGNTCIVITMTSDFTIINAELIS